LKRTGPTNVYLRVLMRRLRKAYRMNGAKIWRAVAKLLDKPRRKRVAVNLSRINRYTEPNDIVVVPGKVLGTGIIDHPVTVAAIKFSESAKEKIEKVGGKCITIDDLLKEHPDGSNIKIIG